MLPSSWKTTLHQLLEQWQVPQSKPPRLAILGIGNPLRSDDAAGVMAARELSRLTRNLDSVLTIEAGHAPENITAELRPFAPEAVILIDAAEMSDVPGAIRWIGSAEIDGLSASTHTLPLSMLAKYLSLEFGCEVRFLGIQPRSNEIGDEVSGDVKRAVKEIVDELAGTLLAEGHPIPSSQVLN